MDITVDEHQIILRPTGELDIATTPPIVDDLTRAFASSTAAVVVFDLAGVTFMDASGVKCLLYAARRVRTRGGRVEIRDMRADLARLLELFGLAHLFDIVPMAHPLLGELDLSTGYSSVSRPSR